MYTIAHSFAPTLRDRPCTAPCAALSRKTLIGYFSTASLSGVWQAAKGEAMSVIRSLGAAIILFGMTQAMPVRAQSGGDAGSPSPVVVELFTSQGCSACPPADELLAELDGRADVIALALHVDYWDYIGWKDRFARPEHTNRQKGYARAAGQRMIYTPQMIIDGADRVMGSDRAAVDAMIRAHQARARNVTLLLQRDGTIVQIAAEALRPLAQPLSVQLVHYLPRARTEITNGENEGHTLNHANVVTDWGQIAVWDGQQPLALRVQAKGDGPVVVILQRKPSGTIEAAAQLR